MVSVQRVGSPARRFAGNVRVVVPAPGSTMSGPPATIVRLDARTLVVAAPVAVCLAHARTARPVCTCSLSPALRPDCRRGPAGDCRCAAAVRGLAAGQQGRRACAARLGCIGVGLPGGGGAWPVARESMVGDCTVVLLSRERAGWGWPMHPRHAAHPPQQPAEFWLDRGVIWREVAASKPPVFHASHRA